jgi:hypothetical protein
MSILYKQAQPLVCNINTDNVSDFILEVRTIILCIGNNSAIFSHPTPSLDTVAQALADLEVAEMFVKDNVPDSIPARNLQRDNVLKFVQELYNYVKNIANKTEDQSAITSIINASGFGLINVGVKAL